MESLPTDAEKRAAIPLPEKIFCCLLDANDPARPSGQISVPPLHELPCGRVPVLLLIGLPRAQEIEELLAAGFAGCLTKPVRYRDLQSRLKNLVKNSPTESPGASTHRTVSAPSAPAPPVAQEIPQDPSLEILLVEDNPTNRMVATALLQKLGHEVISAENGEIAVDLVRQRHFDLVLMDVQMPVLDGLEATRRIRAAEEAERLAHPTEGHAHPLPIIAMTAHAMAGDRELCLEAGMNDYLTKPISLEALRRILGPWSALAGQRRQTLPT
jgi:CheY-like chemotaxis protein